MASVQRTPATLALLFWSLSSSGCFFFASTPQGEILCDAPDACPEGMACNLYRHLCVDDEAPLDAPALLEATLSPTRSSGGVVELRITTSGPIDATSLVITGAPGSHPLPPAAVISQGGSTVIQYAMGLDVPEGLYSLAGIQFSDGAGNVVDAPLELSFVLDRSPPAISNLRVEPRDESIGFADVSPHDTFTLRFSVDERIVEVEGSIGTAELQDTHASAAPCTIETGGQIRCEGSLSGLGLFDGSNSVLVRTTDLAGNVADASTTIVVDVAAPAVVPGTVEITFYAPNGIPSSSLAPEGRLLVRFAVTEALDDDPAIHLTVAGAPMPLTVQRTGLAVEAELTLPPTVTAGVHPLRATLRDEVGHESDAVLLTDPGSPQGVTVTAAIIADCAPVAHMACVDADGDGYLATTATCSAGSDCDDTEPTVFPGAPDFPGDGRRNDCNSDLPETPTALLDAIFVDVANGEDSSATGGPSDPIRTLARAKVLLEAGGDERWIILADTGEYDHAEPTLWREAKISGGFSPGSWTRTTPNSRVLVLESFGVDPNASLTLDHIALTSGALGVAIATGGPASKMVWSDVTVPEQSLSVHTFETVTYIRVGAPDLSTLVDVGALRVIKSVIGRVSVSAAQLTVAQSHLTGAGNTADAIVATLASSVTVTNAFVDGRINCGGCTHLTVHGSRVRSTAVPPIFSASGDLNLVGSAITSVGSAVALLDYNTSPLSNIGLKGNAFYMAQGCPFLLDCAGDDDVDGRLLQQFCPEGGCDIVDNVILQGSQSAFDPLHELPDSPWVNALSDTAQYDWSPMTVVDFDGDCRFDDGAPDIGADEYTP